MDFVTAAEEPNPSHPSATLLGTVAVVDMVGYSSIAKMLEENIDAASVAKLNRQIQAFITQSLQQLPDEQAYRFVSKTGDGAIVFFQHAEDAHGFGVGVHRAAREHTGQRTEMTAERWFRVGIATGEVNVTSALNQPPEYAGIAIANAVRLEGAASAGEILADANTFAKLSGETQKLYAAEEVVKGKRTERFRARRCCVTQGIETNSVTLRLRRRPNVVAAGSLGLVLVLFSPLSIPAARERVRGILFSSSEKHIAVLPLDFTGQDSKSQALGDGLMDSLSGKLANLDPANQSLFVVPASEVRSRKVADPASALREFGATIVIKGRFERNDQTMRLYLTVIDPKKNRVIGYTDVDSSTGDLAAIQDEAIRRLERLANLSATQLPARERGEPATHAAYQNYLAGLGYLQRYDQPGNIDRADTALNDAVKTDPQFALGFACLAQLYLLKYDLDSDPALLAKAEQYGNRAAAIDDQLPSTLLALGQVHELTGDYNLAIDELQRAVKLDPRDTSAIMALASSYHGAGRNSEAEASYTRSITLRPDDWNGYNKLGNFYEALGKHAEAITQFRRAIELTPDNYVLYLDLGNALMNTGDIRQLVDAEWSLERSIVLHPTFQAYSGLGMVFQMQHRYREGVDACEKAVQINDRNYDAWNNLTMAYEWIGDTEKAAYSRWRAISLLRESIKLNSRNADAQATLAALLAKNGMKQEALQRIRTALATSPSSGYVLTEAVDTYETLGDRLTALKYFNEALAYVSIDEMRSDPEMQSVIAAANIQLRRIDRSGLN